MDFSQRGRVIKHVRKGNRKIGTLVAVQFGDKVNYGWSLCCKQDKFDGDAGVMLALRRANSVSTDVKFAMPHSLKRAFKIFHERASRYFAYLDR